MELAKNAGAKRAIPLAVSVPSHCSLMKAASEKLEALLQDTQLHPAETAIVNNADAAFLKDPREIRSSLVRQLNQPLLWEDSIKTMVEHGVDTFIEVGPKKVLSGLIKRIDDNVKIFNVEDVKSLEVTLNALS